MSKVLDVPELQESLELALQEADEMEAKLQLDEDMSEVERQELQEKFDAGAAKVEKLAEALRRKEKMARSIGEIPRPEPQSDGKPPALSLGRVNEPATYRRGGPASFFKDVESAVKGDTSAAARLNRHGKEVKDTMIERGTWEQYAMTTGAGSGVGFVPPQYLQDEWTSFARAARPLADAIGSRPLPTAGVSFNLPRITTGATAAVQATEGAAVTDNSQVTDVLNLTLETITAKTDMSRQAFDRSEPGLDQIIGEDLAAAYALQVDSEIINGPGSGGRVKGILAAAASNTIAATATAVGIYPKIADAVQRVDTLRFLPATLAVFHPRRWGQFLGTLDGQSRPLVVPVPVAVNPFGVGGEGAAPAQGYVNYSIQGLPILKDANVPTNLGAATNEDRIIITRREDLYLFEGPTPTIRVYEEVLSGTLQVRIQVFGYIAFTAERYVNATFLITGLTPPSF